MKKLLFIFLLLTNTIIYCQDTITVMQYNLLNFGYFTSFCTVNNNNPDSKTLWLKSIVDHYLPDLLSVNEISPNTIYHFKILNEALNASGRDYYQKAESTNFAGSTIINMLYYNSLKIGLAEQEVIFTTLRDINVYKLFHKSAYLVSGSDTTFFYYITAHFKSGANAANQQLRAEMAEAVISYLEENNISEPVMLGGDLNLYSSSESAWTILTDTNKNYYFNDPLNRVGNWSSNPEFADTHTQSTQTTSGCGAGGGMDDRFDFVLTNSSLTTESYPVNIIPDTYQSPGQDGLRFKGSLIDPPNTSLPAELIDALYNISDHLPVTLKLIVRTPKPNYVPDLFFSEYVEGSGNNKALELFNPTPYPKDLSNYRLERYVNGSVYADTVSLAGTLPSGKTYVVVIDKRDPNGSGANTPAHPDLIAVADTFLCPDPTINQMMYFNGNDAIALRTQSGELIDLIGKIGEDPGTGWTDDSLCYPGPYTSLCGAKAWTTNHTLVRKFNVTSGIKTNPPFFDVTQQWDSLPNNTFDSLGLHHCLTQFELPPSWEYVTTMSSHIFTITINTNINLEDQPATPGLFIGAFFKNGDSIHCASNVQWFGDQNIAIIVYGDDFLTPEKDGFEINEKITWKILVPSLMKEFDAAATYSSFWPQNNGLFTPNGISEIISLNGKEITNFSLYVSEGWSGVSLPINATWPLLEDIFGLEINNVVVMSDNEHIFYPEQNINQIVEWQEGVGYYIKANSEFSKNIVGYSPSSKTVQLNSGWNIIPVMSFDDIPVSLIDIELGSKLKLIKEVAGTAIYWPEINIQTLEKLSPGKSYFIYLNESGSFSFGE